MGNKAGKDENNKLTIHTHRNKNLLLNIFLAVFIGGYAFFLTSGLWFQNQKLVEATEIGVGNSWEDYEFTILSWEYSEEQKMMEILIDVKNRSMKEVNAYDVAARERKSGTLDAEIVVNEEDFIVVHLDNIARRWSEIVLHVSLKGETDYLKLYTNKNSVTCVEEIRDMTENEYYCMKYQAEIAICEGNITNLEEQIKENDGDMASYQNRVQELEESKEFQTVQEMEETDALIRKAEEEISELETTNSLLAAQIQEEQEKIQKYKDLQGNYE